jgi:hypothetical protein
MITLSLGGLSVSAIGLFLGVKRVRRGTERIVRAATLHQPVVVSQTADARMQSQEP